VTIQKSVRIHTKQTIAHPETSVFGCALSAISFRLSAKDIQNKVLADCCSLTAESSIQKLIVSGWKPTKYLIGKKRAKL